MTLMPTLEVTASNWAERIEQLRHDVLCGDDDTDDLVLTPQAEQHHLLMIAALEQAQRHAKLALYLSRKGE